MPDYAQTDSGLYVADGLQNVVSGLGTGNDKRSFNRFRYGANMFDFAQLEAAFQESWIARQVVTVPVDDAIREWRSWKHEEAAAVEDEEKRLEVPSCYKSARYWARLYGGAAILMITDQDLDKPLDLDRIREGSLRRLVVLDRWEVQPQRVNYTDPTAEDYLRPETYTVYGGTQEIHSSHVVRVDGEDLPRRLRSLNQTWGDSTLRKILDDLQDVHATQAAVAALVQESNVDVITKEGLSEELASGQEDEILKRYALGNRMKSTVNQLLLDGNESFERKEVTFSGLGDILDKNMIWVSGAADVPMTRLFGRSAAGMDASGEGDLNNYYDSVASMQRSQFTPDLEKLDQVMIRSAGVDPEEADYVWNPLYQESGTELAQQDLARAQADDIRLNQGTLQPHHVAERIRQEGQYPVDEEFVQAITKQDQEELTGGFAPEPDPAAPVGDDAPTFTPPKPVQDAARQALSTFDGDSGPEVVRAQDLANGRPVTEDTIHRMVSYFARHGRDSETYRLWGGDAAYAWAHKVAGDLDAG